MGEWCGFGFQWSFVFADVKYLSLHESAFQKQESLL